MFNELTCCYLLSSFVFSACFLVSSSGVNFFVATPCPGGRSRYFLAGNDGQGDKDRVSVPRIEIPDNPGYFFLPGLQKIEKQCHWEGINRSNGCVVEDYEDRDRLFFWPKPISSLSCLEEKKRDGYLLL
ncbi:hypothetical protein AVEN_266802-1 [Araneus ventricosus]|uniref:Uncharacterized protein n=1 Tax=Araneus ventricosus TaxID=182803 RepID=A0A4Y2HCY1_ARAVE|nr:hypothetical protein AVEN_266802-1 [Araneus ventricosus]